jgi:hypothetical protein
MTRNRERILAISIVILFAVLGVIYSVITPILEAGDEVSHYPYVAYLAAGNGLPVQGPDAGLWDQEGSQPPLYYILAAILTAPIDTADLTEIRQRNPHAMIGIPLAESNKNGVIHTDQERWPWEGTVLAIHLARFFSVVLGAGTVWTCYRLARKIFPGRPLVALGAESFIALNPTFLFLSGSVNNDNLIIFLASLVLLRLIEVIHCELTKHFLPITGLLIGCACLTKLSGLALLPLTAVALVFREIVHAHDTLAGTDGAGQAGTVYPDNVSWRGMWSALWRREALRRWVVSFVRVLLPAILVAGWWYLRNQVLYGDLTGLNAMLDVFGRRNMDSLTWQSVWGEFRGFRISFWGMFGMVNVLMRPQWVYTLFDLLTLAAIIGYGRSIVYRWRHYEGRGARWYFLLDEILLAVWIAAVCASLLRWTSMTKASQGRLIFPALGAIAPLFVFGWLSWFRPSGRRWAVLGLLLPLAALAVTSPWVAIRRPTPGRPF